MGLVVFVHVSLFLCPVLIVHLGFVPTSLLLFNYITLNEIIIIKLLGYI